MQRKRERGEVKREKNRRSRNARARDGSIEKKKKKEKEKEISDLSTRVARIRKIRHVPSNIARNEIIRSLSIPYFLVHRWRKSGPSGRSASARRIRTSLPAKKRPRMETSPRRNLSRRWVNHLALPGYYFSLPPLSPSPWNNESRKKLFSRARIVGIDEYDSIYPKARIWRSSNCCFQAVRLATFPT